MRKWLINLFKEALLENDLRVLTEIRSTRDPNSCDVTGTPGAVWHNIKSNQRWVLKNMHCYWRPLGAKE